MSNNKREREIRELLNDGFTGKQARKILKIPNK